MIYPSHAYSQPSHRHFVPSFPLSAFAMMTSVEPYRLAGKLSSLTFKRPLVVSPSPVYGFFSLVGSLRLNDLSCKMNNPSKSSIQPGSRLSSQSPTRLAPARQFPAHHPLSGLAGNVYGNGNGMLPQQHDARLMSPNAIFARDQPERFATTHSRDGGSFAPPPLYQSRNPTEPVSSKLAVQISFVNKYMSRFKNYTGTRRTVRYVENLFLGMLSNPANRCWRHIILKVP